MPSQSTSAAASASLSLTDNGSKTPDFYHTHKEQQQQQSSNHYRHPSASSSSSCSTFGSTAAAFHNVNASLNTSLNNPTMKKVPVVRVASIPTAIAAITDQSSDEDDDDDEEMNQIYENQKHVSGTGHVGVSALASPSATTHTHTQHTHHTGTSTGMNMTTPNHSNYHPHHHHHPNMNMNMLRRTPGANAMHKSAALLTFQKHHRTPPPPIHTNHGALSSSLYHPHPSPHHSDYHHHLQNIHPYHLQNIHQQQQQHNMQYEPYEHPTPVLRRTPGANAMHRSKTSSNSSNNSVTTTPTTSSSATTDISSNNCNNKTTVAVTAKNSNHDDNVKNISFTPKHRTKPSSSTTTSSMKKPPLKNNRTDITKDGSSGGGNSYLYTPAGVSLARNKNLNLRSTANGHWTPQTAQLVSSINNLFHDENQDNGDVSGHSGAGDDDKNVVAFDDIVVGDGDVDDDEMVDNDINDMLNDENDHGNSNIHLIFEPKNDDKNSSHNVDKYIIMEEKDDDDDVDDKVVTVLVPEVKGRKDLLAVSQKLLHQNTIASEKYHNDIVPVRKLSSASSMKSCSNSTSSASVTSTHNQKTRSFPSITTSTRIEESQQQLPSIQNSSSFGAESNTSVISSLMSHDHDWNENFTLDTSKDFTIQSLHSNKSSSNGQTKNAIKANVIDAAAEKTTATSSSQISNFDGPKFLSSSFRTVDKQNSDLSSTNNSVSNSLPGSSSHFVPAHQSSKSLNHQQRQHNHKHHYVMNEARIDDSTYIHAPKPVKPADAVPVQNTTNEERLAEHGKEFGQSLLHHQYHNQHQHQQPNLIPPQYVETNPTSYEFGHNNNIGYDTNMSMYPYLSHNPHLSSIANPMHHQPHPYQFQPHHMDYLNHHLPQPPHHHLVPHPSISPATIPSSMSPLTIPSFPSNMRYGSQSPVPFAPTPPPLQHQTSQMPWAINHHHHHHPHLSTAATSSSPSHMQLLSSHHHSPYNVPNTVMDNVLNFHPISNNNQMYHFQESTFSSHEQQQQQHQRQQQQQHHQQQLHQQNVYDHNYRAKNLPLSHNHTRNKSWNNNKWDTNERNGNLQNQRNNNAKSMTTMQESQKKHRFDKSLASSSSTFDSDTTSGKVKFVKSKYSKRQMVGANDEITKKGDDNFVTKAKQEKISQKKALTDSSARRKNKDNQVQTASAISTKKGRDKTRGSTETDLKKQVTPEEEEAELNRSKLVETPAMRVILKEFYRTYRAKEKISLDCAADFARSCLDSEEFPVSVQWRIYLELADLSKRANKFKEARTLYKKVCTIQPYACQGWLEYSKLEEECGNLTECSRILKEGLRFCEFNENLLTRALKHEERSAREVGNRDLRRARELLAPLKHCNIEKVWRVVLEGALMEARAGNEVEARRILKYLMHWIPWYGPLYLEAFRLERDYERPINALGVVERGLKEIQRYGPLWFGAFRVCEGLDIDTNDLHLPRTLGMIERSTECISRELIWKVHLEAAQAHERAAHLAVEKDATISLDERLAPSRKRFVITVSNCPSNLHWKVWLAAGRMELSAGRFNEARKLFLKSYSVVPVKGRPSVLLECARLEEFVGDIELSKAILCKSRNEEGSDWKVWLQSVSIEIRCGNRQNAIQLTLEGLKIHHGTGRLWAALVQLREEDGEKSQMNALKQALYAVPKSGEVWCESARMFLNPLSSMFDLNTAKKHLEFATKFTPQYGDSFLETLRMQIIQKLVIPSCKTIIDGIKSKLARCFCEKDYSHENFIETLSSSLREAASMIEDKDLIPAQADITTALDALDMSDLELHCSNADPNYGKLWFHCRLRPSDTARTVLRRAKEVIGHNIGNYGHLYAIAIMRRIAIEMMTTQRTNCEINSNDANASIDSSMECINRDSLELLLNVPSLKSLLQVRSKNNFHGDDDLQFFYGESSSTFATGIVELNKIPDLQSLRLIERRKILFGSDLLL